MLYRCLDSPGGLRQIVEPGYSKGCGFGEGIECVSIGESKGDRVQERIFRIVGVPCAASSGVSDKSNESSVPSDNLKIGKALDKRQNALGRGPHGEPRKGRRRR